MGSLNVFLCLSSFFALVRFLLMEISFVEFEDLFGRECQNFIFDNKRHRFITPYKSKQNVCIGKSFETL